MKKIEDISELRQIQLSILDAVHRFCQERGLRYFLSSGTLIGAVRHKGYIPWDDDLDIYMPRADYEAFLATYADPEGRYAVMDPDRRRDYYYTFAKVVDRRTKLVEECVAGRDARYDIGVYIDVFPVDYVSDDERRRRRVFRLKKLLYKVRLCKLADSCPLDSRLAYFCYRHLPVSVGRLQRWLRRLIVLREPTATVCNMTEAGPTTTRGCFPAADIAGDVDIEFEGRLYKTMVGYDDYLTRTYGDYMQLPPVEQRTTHQFRAYWL